MSANAPKQSGDERRLGAAADHHVGVAVADLPERLADRDRARRAAHRVRAVRARARRTRWRCCSSTRRRTRSSASIGSTRAQPLRQEDARAALRRSRRRRARCPSSTPMRSRSSRGEVDPRVLERLPRRDDGELPEPVEPLRALRLEVVGRDEVVHLGRVVAAEDRRVESRERSHRRALGAHAVPQAAPA